MFASNSNQARRVLSIREEGPEGGAMGSGTSSAHVGLDENCVPGGVETMAGKVGAIPRRSILGSVSGNNTAAMTVETKQRVANLFDDAVQGIGSGAIRNLRAKTLQQSIVVKGREGSTSFAAGDFETGDSGALLPVDEEAENMTASGASSHAHAHAQSKHVGPVFPVKMALRRIPSAESMMDKENVDPVAAGQSAVPRAWDDLDAEDLGDPLMVSDYVVEIFEYMRSLEKKILPRQNYIAHQKELNWHMRSILVDWLSEVQWKLKLLPETLYLSINIIDRFLSCRAVSMSKLQLVGLAATLLASKYEEVVSPSINNFIFLADYTYKPEELLNAERYILQILGFSLTYPSPMSYLRRISKAENYDIRSRTLAKYLMEIALLDQNFVSVPPSLLSAVGIYTARLMLRSGPWTINLVHYSGYEEGEVRRYCNRLIYFLQQEQHYVSIHRKYSSKKYMKASVFVYDWIKKEFPSAPALKEVYYNVETSAANSPA